MRIEKRWEEVFKRKKITMLGLGLLGRGVNVARFLAEQGAILTITDLKTTEQLAPSLRALKKYKNIRFHLGGHRMSDFRNADMVIKAAGVPLDSPYVKEARKQGISVEMDASLFAKLAPEGVTIVGITGTRGKSTVSHLIYHISSRTLLDEKPIISRRVLDGRVFLGGNVRGMATLPLLKKVRRGDVVVLELDSWQLQGFGDAKISPQIAVFTTFFPDHLNYYKGDLKRYFADKTNIFKYQKRGDTLIAGDGVAKKLPASVRKHVILVSSRSLPRAWRLRIPGEHNRFNAACAAATCRALGISEKDIKKGVESFRGVPGRLEFVCETKGVKYYNDTTATSPEGLYAALDALTDRKKNIILIAGGADKSFDYRPVARRMHKSVKALILFKGTGTDKIVATLPKKKSYPFFVVGSMKEAIVAARACARRGDTVLLSPGTSSFGVFKNEFDRGDQFMKMVKKIT